MRASLSEGFKEVDGCVVPSSFNSRGIWSGHRPRTDNIDDATGFECLASKTYLEDALDGEVPLSELCRIGLRYFFYLRKSIDESRLSGHFRFIVDAQIRGTEEIYTANACSVRFHKIRPGQSWLSEDLESYKHNALLVVDWESYQLGRV